MREQREENDELRERLNSPGWGDWFEVTRSAPEKLRSVLWGVAITVLGFSVSLVSAWSEAALSVSPPELVPVFGLAVSFLGVAVLVAVPVASVLLGGWRRIRGWAGV